MQGGGESERRKDIAQSAEEKPTITRTIRRIRGSRGGVGGRKIQDKKVNT